MADYSFVTVWRLEAPIERVYQAIHDSLAWPDWWPAVKSVEEVRPATDRGGIGTVRRYTFKGSLPYTLSFDMTVERVEPPTVLAGRATGELDGTGVWTIHEEDGVTFARYDWNVRTTRWWMNLVAPIRATDQRTSEIATIRIVYSPIWRVVSGMPRTTGSIGTPAAA
jgi:uncharacterized protein YndB with AHSA1/START domain